MSDVHVYMIYSGSNVESLWLVADETGCLLVTTARCRPDHCRKKTQSRVCTYEKLAKNTYSGRKRRFRLKEWMSVRAKALMMLKIGPWLWYTPQVNHCYSLLSTYLSPCPPISPLPRPGSVSHSLPRLTLTQLLLRPHIQNFHLQAILTLSP